MRCTGKALALQFTKSMVILLAVILAVLLAMVLTGNFKIDNNINNFGIYESRLKGSPGYFDVGLETLEIVQCIALLVFLPVVLIVKHFVPFLKDISVRPWIVVILFGVFEMRVWPGPYEASANPMFDHMLQTILPEFLHFEVALVLGGIIGYGLWACKRIHKQQKE